MILRETNIDSALMINCIAPPKRVLRSLKTARSDDGDNDADAGLEETFKKERDYLRGRLRDELRREPTEAELDEWLQQHTEGY